MSAVIYARFSSHNQTEQSIEGQVRECAQYADKKGLTVTEIYADRAISGKTDQRPEFQRMLNDAKQKKFTDLIVYKTDRFSRDKYTSAVYKRQLFTYGIKIHYAAEPLPEGPTGLLMETFLEGLAQYYSAELSEKIKRGMKESAYKCHYTGGSVPLGYRIKPDKSFEVDPDQAKVVQKVFSMYNQGIIKSKICEFLNHSGYTTSYGNPFNKCSIDRIITNEKYIGVYEYYGIRVEGGVPAIIDEITFLKAQDEKERRRMLHGSHVKKSDYLLTGRAFCKYCGAKLVGVSGTSETGKTYRYYYCPNNRGQKKDCQLDHISADDLENEIAQICAEDILNEFMIPVIAEEVYDYEVELREKDEELKELQRRLAQNKKAASNVQRAIEADYEGELLPARLKELEKERKYIEHDIENYEKRHFVLTKEQLEFFMTNMLNRDKETLLKAFVNKVITSNDEFEIFFNLTDKYNESGLFELKASSPKAIDGGAGEHVVELIGLHLKITAKRLL